VFYGWWVVAISVIADGLKHGSFNRGFTIYVLPIRHELGIGVAAIAFADMMGRLLGGVQGPVVGYMTDRYGPRVMLFFGALVSGLGFIALAFVHNYIVFILVFVGLLSLGFRSGYNNASITALNQWFRRRRGLAMSIASVGNGLGGALAPLVGLLVVTAGWRTAVFISGAIIILVIGPLSLLLRNSPESMGLLPDGDRADDASGPESPGRQQSGEAAASTRPRRAQPARDVDFTAKEAMRTPTYWLIVMSVGFRNTVHSGVSFLLAPIMVWFLQGAGRGETESLLIASFFVMALALSTIVFNPAVGLLGDRVSKQKLSAVCMVGGALALFTLLNHSGHLWQLLIFSVLLAFSESANPLAWAIMGDAFGRRSFATLRGWQHLPDQLMSMSTPVWMGWIYDNTDSYYWALLPLIVLYIMAAVGYWTIPRPRLPARLRTREQAQAGRG
jgi:MFS family permease